MIKKDRAKTRLVEHCVLGVSKMLKDTEKGCEQEDTFDADTSRATAGPYSRDMWQLRKLAKAFLV